MTREERREMRRGMRGHSRVWTGLLLLVIGGLLLLRQTGSILPEWIFTWQFLLIGLGVFFGISKKFKGAGWLMMILVGGVFLAADFHPEWELRKYTTPIILIIIGLAFVFRPRRCKDGDDWRSNKAFGPKPFKDPAPDPVQFDSDQYLDVTSVFGGTKKNITTKDFKGGEVTNFMGGTELNMGQADINGRVVLEVTQVFGGTKLIVPSHWEVRTESISVFAGIEDKRQLTTVDPTKVLVLKGTSVFAGIDIRSY